MGPSALFARRSSVDAYDVRAIAARKSERKFSIGSLINYSSRTVLVGAVQVDFARVLPDALRQRAFAACAAPDALDPELIELLAAECDAIQEKIRSDGKDPDEVMALIEPHEKFRGIYVPRRLISPEEKGPGMSNLVNDAPAAATRLKALCDDEGPINEAIIVGYNKATRTVRNYYDVRGAKVARPKSLSEEELQEFITGYAKSIAKRHYGQINAPELRPLDDVTLGIQPLAGQDEAANIIFLIVFISLGRHDSLLHIAMDEHVPAVSRELLSAFGRTKGKPSAPPPPATSSTRAMN